MAARGTGVYISPVYLNANKSEGLSSDSDSSSLKDDEENRVEHPKSRGWGAWEIGVPAGCHDDLALHGHAGPRSTVQPPPPPPPPPRKPHQHGYQQCSPVACTLSGRTVPNARLSLDVTPNGPGYPANEPGRRSIDALSPVGHQLQQCSFEGLPPLGSTLPRSSITAFYAASQHPCVERSNRTSLESTAHCSSIDLGGRSSVDFVGRSSIDLMAAHDFNRAMSLQDRVSFEAMHSTSTGVWFSSQQQGAGCNTQQACARNNPVTCMLQSTLAAQPPAAVYNSSQLYNQQQRTSMQTAAGAMSRNLSAPLPATQSPNCVQYTPISQQQQQQQQQVAGCMSSPQPSGEYLCMMPAPCYNSMADPRCSSNSFAAQHVCSRGSSRTGVQPVPSATRPCSNSFTADSRTVQQQPLLQQQDLAAAIGGMGTCLSCPLPLLLPPQQHQQQPQQRYMSEDYVPVIPEQQQQQQVSADYAMDTTVQEMLLKELQVQELVAGVAASNQVTPIPSPTLHMPPPQQQCGFTGAVSVSSNGHAGAIPAGIQLADPVISAPLMGLCDAAPDVTAGLCASGVGSRYVNCANSNMLLQQQQLQSSQQLPSAAAAALMCSEPLLSPATTMQQRQQPQVVCAGSSTAQMKMQQLVAVQHWQHSIEEELLQLLPMA